MALSPEAMKTPKNSKPMASVWNLRLLFTTHWMKKIVIVSNLKALLSCPGPDEVCFGPILGFIHVCLCLWKCCRSLCEPALPCSPLLSNPLPVCWGCSLPQLPGCWWVFGALGWPLESHLAEMQLGVQLLVAAVWPRDLASFPGQILFCSWSSGHLSFQVSLWWETWMLCWSQRMFSGPFNFHQSPREVGYALPWINICELLKIIKINFTRTFSMFLPEADGTLYFCVLRHKDGGDLLWMPWCFSRWQHSQAHGVWFVGCPVQGQALDCVILMGPLQLSTFYGLMNLGVILHRIQKKNKLI